MKLKNADIKQSLSSYTHSLRVSQIATQYGVGAMIDFPEQTLMTAAPEYWKGQVKEIHDERLEKALHVDYFGTPCDKEEKNGKDGVSFVRFPEWYFCPKCRRFMPILDWVKEYKQKDRYMVNKLTCTKCYQELVPTRIVTVCEHGHIDDFPWVKWVHSQNINGRKPVCMHPRLTFKTTASSSEGLEGITITCETCHAKATLRGAFSNGIFEEIDEKTNYEYNYKCTGKHPWKHTQEKCDCYPRTLQRGSSSVYFPVVANSLVIPPYSSMLNKKIEDCSDFSKCRDEIKTTLDTMREYIPKAEFPTKRKVKIKEIIEKYSNIISLEISVDSKYVNNVLLRKWESDESVNSNTRSVQYKAEEYEALTGEMSFNTNSEDDFARESTDIAAYHLPFVKQIALIHKVREVQALIGFSRLKPVEQPEGQQHTQKFVSVKEPETNWYPAYQVRGEGIFIEFNQSDINTWIKGNPEVEKRADILNVNYEKSFIGANNPRTINAKFLLLHTLSHLLIKQLSFECGYGIASLKERIYCSEESQGKQMAGIFIYTANGDSEGTLGGLVRQGRSDVFPAIFRKAIEGAISCSNDPVCSLSQGQGRDSLNLASCYSCTLLPETSCEEYNIFLDRGVIVGTYDNKNMGFFKEQLYSENGWNTPTQSDIIDKENTTSSKNKSENYEISNDGIYLGDVLYADIWDNILGWSEDDNEKKLLMKLKTRSDELRKCEKPYKETEFELSDGEKFSCDLYWKHAQIAYFTSDNDESYKMAKKYSHFTCYIGSENLDPQNIIDQIRGIQ